MSGLKGDWTDAITRFTQAIELADRYGLKAFGAAAKSGLGRALVATGQLDDGTRLLRDGYSGWTTFGGRHFSTALAAGAAEVLLDAGRRDEATEFMLTGEKTQQETEEKYQAAPFLSLRARLAELDGDPAGAETAYRRAIEVAEHQGGAAVLAPRGNRTGATLSIARPGGRGRRRPATVLREVHRRLRLSGSGPRTRDARKPRMIQAVRLRPRGRSQMVPHRPPSRRIDGCAGIVFPGVSRRWEPASPRRRWPDRDAHSPRERLQKAPQWRV
jgi:MalT-like TPR region